MLREYNNNNGKRNLENQIAGKKERKLVKKKDKFINKMSTLIAHKDLWASKPSYDILKYELHNCSGTTILNLSFLFPSSQIFCHSDDVSRSCVLSWWVDRSQKINVPFIKCL
jgi:hypothetical protein